MRVANQRGRAKFVGANVLDCAACPLPNLLDSGDVRVRRVMRKCEHRSS